MKLRDYLTEGTFAAGGSWADCTDNFPPSTTIFGERMDKKVMDTVNGKIVRFENNPDFKYDDWKNSDGMENPRHFHKSVFGLRSFIKREDFHPKETMTSHSTTDDMSPMDVDAPGATVNPEQEGDPQYAVNRKEFRDFANSMKTLPTVRIGDDRQEYYKLDIDKLVQRHLTEDMNPGKFKGASGPKNLYTWNGTPFWSGAFDPLDGFIIEVHTFEEAEEADFHHSFYFNDRTVAKMERDKLAFFWLDKTGLNTMWRNDEAPPKIKKAIMAQIKKR